MLNKLHSLYLLICLLLLALSCAKAPIKKTKNVNKSYDQGVEDEFSKIENDQRDVLDYYRRLRSENWDNYKRKYNRPTRTPKLKTKTYRPQKHNDPQEISSPSPSPQPQHVPERESLPQAQIDEIKIEVRQHMDYFCMQKRKSRRFSDTADCLAFTENIYSRCMAAKPIIYDRSIVKCIRNKLH